MIVNDIELPVVFQESLTSGRWLSRGDKQHKRWCTKKDVDDFKSVFVRVRSPRPVLYDFKMIEEFNAFWQDKGLCQYYLGEQSDRYKPGSIEPKKIVIIGETEPDSYIGIDFRTHAPSVVYMCDIDFITYWVVACQTIEELLDKLKLY